MALTACSSRTFRWGHVYTVGCGHAKSFRPEYASTCQLSPLRRFPMVEESLWNGILWTVWQRMSMEERGLRRVCTKQIRDRRG